MMKILIVDILKNARKQRAERRINRVTKERKKKNYEGIIGP